MRVGVSNLIPGTFRYQPQQVSILLTTAALVLWALSLTQAKLVLDDWGIIHSLPPSFFAAIALLTIASFLLWLSRQNHDLLLCLQLCFFIAMLWLTPLILGTTLMSTRWEFGYHSTTQYIIHYGHIDPVSLWSHNWPSLGILGTALVEVLGIQNADQMLIWAPFVLQLIMVLPFYLFFRNIMGRSNYCWAAIWIFYLFNHVGQFFFGHQTLALFLMWTLLAMLARTSARGESKTPAHQTVIILILVCLTLTHLLTSLALLFVMVFLWLIKRQKIGTLVLFFTVSIVSWTMYVATNWFSSQVPLLFERIFRLDSLWGWNVTARATVGSEVHLLVVNIRIWLTALIGAIALAGLGLSRKFRSGADGTVLVIAGGILLMLPFGFYEGEMISRTFLFLLPPLAYFAVSLLKTKVSAFIFLIVLLVALPFSIISLHGNQAMEHISPNQRDYWHFIEDKTTEGRFTGAGMIGWSLDYLSPRFYDSWLHGDITEVGMRNLLAGKWPPGGEAAYIALSSYEEAEYRIDLDKPQYVPELRSWLDSSTDYDLIYTSGDVSAYRNDGIE